MHCLFIFFFLAHLNPVQLISSQKQSAVVGLISRLLGPYKSQLFSVHIIPSNSESKSPDSFTLQKVNQRIIIVGTSGVAAAYGFHYYLKYFCNCHVSWDYDQLHLPDELPDVNLTKKSFDRYRYYQNVCTYSYSYVWWSWKRWEREIDWMALNGINMALAFTGQEAIWNKVYKHLNLTDSEISEHFTGAAFLAWNRMANIRSWGGPLSQTWLRKQKFLQKKILTRMTSLGIIPVLPAFCGHVPRGVKRLYPDAHMTRVSAWAKFPDQYCCPYLLDPGEPLFDMIGNLFYQTLKEEFGLFHFHNCDIFNEIRPPNNSSEYLKNISATVIRALTNYDENATWIMQGWLFASDSSYWHVNNVEYFLSGVPNDKMIILDLQSDSIPMYKILHSYFGKPFIWCMLHNFGGTLGMHGSIDIINERILNGRMFENSTMIGIGLTPEGINQNYIIYDFMIESGWRNETVNIDKWLEQYSNRRYGGTDVNLQSAWKLLGLSVYNYKLAYPLHGQYTYVLRPSFSHQPWTWYNVSKVEKAWFLFLNTSNENFLLQPNYKHDLVDITRQVLQNVFDKYYMKLVDSYYKLDLDSFGKNSVILLGILVDFENILATNEHFTLGTWLEAAKKAAYSEDEKKVFEINARNQISLWGPKGEIRDYAVKQWAGIVRNYCLPRWNLFFDVVLDYMKRGIIFKQHDFDLNVFNSVELPFTYNREEYPKSYVGDTYFVARNLFNKWKKEMNL